MEKRNNRMETLACIIADLKAENIEMTQRVHQLVDEYNDVVHQLNGKEECKDEDPSRQTLGEMLKMCDHCDKLEKEHEQLKRQCVQLQTERNETKPHADTCEILKEELFKHIARFENSEFLKIGDVCTLRDSLLDGKPVNIGSGECISCWHLIKVDVFGRKCVLCACRYDNTKAEEAQACKNTDKKD